MQEKLKNIFHQMRGETGSVKANLKEIYKYILYLKKQKAKFYVSQETYTVNPHLTDTSLLRTAAKSPAKVTDV